MAHPNIVRPQIVPGNWLLSSLLCSALIPFWELFGKVAHHIRTPARNVLPWERRTWRSALDPSLGGLWCWGVGVTSGFSGHWSFLGERVCFCWIWTSRDGEEYCREWRCEGDGMGEKLVESLTRREQDKM